jgi:SAM-dependent methyltransferase
VEFWADVVENGVMNKVASTTPHAQTLEAGRPKLQRMAHLKSVYSSMLQRYFQTGVIQTLDPNDKENQFKADWQFQHYFNVGDDALRIIVSALEANLRSPPETILDFPCGSGRVTRSLAAFFKGAMITACDLYESHVKFCVDTFGVEGSASKENFEELDFGKKFDLIFCGSLLTHLPEHKFWSALNLICRSLSETGIAVITLQGRYSRHIQHNLWKYLADDLFAVAEAGFLARGFGFVDYEHGFNQDVFNKNSSYGIALASPSYVTAELQSKNDVRLLGYIEREWDDHQDVLVLGKPPTDCPPF